MKKVFISGSIKIKRLPEVALQSLENIIRKKMYVLVGDAFGVDALVQKFFSDRNYFNISIYTIKNKPRNLLNPNFKCQYIDWKISDEYLHLTESEKKQVEYSERKKQTFKDLAMVKDTDYIFAIWDGKSEGTKNNILNGMKKGKQSKVILNDVILPREKRTPEVVKNIYEKNVGINFNELKRRMDTRLGEEDVAPIELLKKESDLQNYYPYSTKTFLKETEGYSDFLIPVSYRGKTSLNYKPDIIEKLVFDYREVLSKIQGRKQGMLEEQLFSILN